MEARPQDYQVAYDRAFRGRSRSRFLTYGLLGGLLYGAGYFVAASAGNERFDTAPAFSIIAVTLRF